MKTGKFLAHKITFFPRFIVFHIFFFNLFFESLFFGFGVDIRQSKKQKISIAFKTQIKMGGQLTNQKYIEPALREYFSGNKAFAANDMHIFV